MKYYHYFGKFDFQIRKLFFELSVSKVKYLKINVNISSILPSVVNITQTNLNEIVLKHLIKLRFNYRSLLLTSFITKHFYTIQSIL